MYTRQQLENILFLDIETASIAPTYGQLDERFRDLWDKKAALIAKREEGEEGAEQLFIDKAAIFAEFGKVVCVSCGSLKFVGDRPTFKMKSYFGSDEKEILVRCGDSLNKFMASSGRNLCAHNGKEFDFPYLGRRYLINGLVLPVVLGKIQAAKPWEVPLIDTMMLWKFGDFKSFTSLDLLCAVLDIPSPKDDMDGSMVGSVYWEEKDYKRIAKYCEQDVVATAQVLLRFSREALLLPEDIQSV